MSELAAISYQRQRSGLKPPFLLDTVLVITTVLLVGFGLLMVYSTTGVTAQERYNDSWYFTKRQLFSALIGLMLMFVLSHVKIDFLRKISPYLFIVSIFLLLLPLIPGLSERSGGASRWIKVAGLRFQPVEFVKVAFVVFLAGYFARHQEQIGSFMQGIVKPFLIVGLVGGLLLAQPDFGSSAIIASVAVCMALAAGVKLRDVFSCLVGLTLLAATLVICSPYRMTRVLAFTAPWADASGKGYQLIQSLIAIGSGHISGVGLGAGQQKLFFLPAAHTDFIFAVIAEELGFIGCLVSIILFVLFLWRGLALAVNLAEDAFSFTLAIGLTGLIVVPAMLNIGVVTGLLPTKGLVLPLIGYGGSSMVACLCAIGLLLALTRSYLRSRI